MKTNWSCLSNLLVRMKRPYCRIACAAIVALSGLVAGQVRADERQLCVLVPHFKDEYWLSVAYGLEKRAEETGLTVRFFEAGGYNALARQITQLDTCATLGPGAILIGAVSSDAPDLLAAVQKAARGRPVIGLVNELHSDALSARIGVDWSEMGLLLGRHLAERFPAAGRPQEAVFLSGPPEAGWVAPLEDGLRRGLSGSAITITATYGADTGTAEQLRLLETALADHPRPDILIGSAPAIEAAMALFAEGTDRPLLAATYLSQSVARGLVGHRVLAAPFDDPIAQGRLAIDAADAAMAGHGARALIAPRIIVFGEGIEAEAVKLSPADYFPKLD